MYITIISIKAVTAGSKDTLCFIRFTGKTYRYLPKHEYDNIIISIKHIGSILK